MKAKALIYIIIAGVCWGTSGIFTPFLASYGFSGLRITAMRGLVAFACVAIYVLLFKRHAFLISLQQLIMTAFVGMSLFLTSALYYSAIDMTSVSTAVMLMYTAPVLVMIFSVLFLGERISLQKIFAVIFMLVGCALVSGVIGGIKFDLIGILLGLGAGVAYATYNILTKISMEHKYEPLSTVLYGFMFMALIALCTSRPWEILKFTSIASGVIIPSFIALGAITMALPYFLYTLGMRDLPAGTASALGIVEPMSATLFSIIIFREPFDLFMIFGIVLILSAVVMLSLAKEKRRNKDEKSIDDRA